MRQVDLVNVFDSAGEAALSAGVKDARIAELEAENERLRGLLKAAARRIRAHYVEADENNRQGSLH